MVFCDRQNILIFSFLNFSISDSSYKSSWGTHGTSQSQGKLYPFDLLTPIVYRSSPIYIFISLFQGFNGSKDHKTIKSQNRIPHTLRGFYLYSTREKEKNIKTKIFEKHKLHPEGL